ncbi:Vacuolar protein sorting-associated protein 51 [Borealophlyctis nickersoniae]|nr:Vacuolar protein sorting-associated protein 51 [Borealophlyctis nickersoniae]
MPSPPQSPHPPRSSSLVPGSPNSGDAGAAGRAAARQRKKRDLLKNYYGLAGIGKAAETKSNKPDPLDLDNFAFNAELAVNNALVEQSLPELIQRDNDLVSEIKELDGDMKTLVYENYNKFIAATDTIRKMKVNVENMESEMDMLSKNVEKITQAASTINQGLAEQRTKIHQLSGVHNLLKKLNFVFELPTRLNQCVQKKLYAQAVRYYSRTSNLLSHYRHLAVFKTIEDECKVIMDGVAEIVKEKLENDTSTTAEISESVGLLLGLNAMPPLDLANEHIKSASVQLRRVKSNAVRHNESMQLNASSPSTDNVPPDVALVVEKVAHLNDTFLRDLAAFVTAYDSYFLKETAGPSPSSTGSSDSRSTFVAKLTSEQRQQARDSLMRMVEKMNKEYFEVIDGLLHIPDDISKVSPLLYVHVLDKLHRDIHQMEPLKQIAKMHKRANAMTFELLGKVINAVFGKIKKEFFDRYKSLEQERGTSDLVRVVNDLNKWMKDSLINQCLPLLEEFVKPSVTFMKNSELGTDDVLDLIQRSLDVFWISFTEDMLSYNTPKPGGTPPAVTSLGMSRSAFELSSGTVEGVMSAYCDVLFSKKQDMSHAGPKLGPPKNRRGLQVVTASGGTVGGVPAAGYYAQGGLADGSEIAIRAREIAGFCRATAQKLLTQYVERVASDLSAFIQCYLEDTDWTAIGAPEDISEPWKKVIENFASVERDVGQLYQDDGTLERKDRGSIDSGRRSTKLPSHSRTGSSQLYKNPHHSSSQSSFLTAFNKGATTPGGMGKFDALLSNIDKLFAERIEYFGPVEMNKGAVLMGIAKVVVKCFIEGARLFTLNKEGFHQIQIDVEFLKAYLWQYTTDDRLLGDLLDEVLSSAVRRCVDPEPLEYADIERYLNAYERRDGSL